MFSTPIPLLPKNPHDPLKVLVIGRISTVHQNIENIDASYRYVETYLRQLYSGRLELKHLGEQASGMVTDRATVREAEDLIATGEWDLVIAEDLSRIFRNPRHQFRFVQDAVDAETRVICIADHLDSADENWEIMMGAAALRHGTAIPDIRRRVRRTATHAFHSGGMVLKVKYGYRKLTREEASSGLYGPVGLRIARRPECTPILREMRDRVLRGDHYEGIAEWLVEHMIETAPYATRWTAALVRALLADPILAGRRTFRTMIHRPVFRTGKHRRVRNPEPESEHVPELAHFTPEEHETLLKEMHGRADATRQRLGSTSRTAGRPRSRVVWPGQHARCAVCGAVMHSFGRFLRCATSRRTASRRCWNHVQVSCEIVRAKVLPWLVESLQRIPGAWEAFQSQALSPSPRAGPPRFDELERTLQSLEAQAVRLTDAIARGGRLV